VMPKLGAAEDAEYRKAYLDLRHALMDVIIDLRKLEGHLEHLLRIMEHLPFL